MTATPITAVTADSVGEQLDRLPVGAVHRKVVVAVGLGLFFEMYEIFLSSTLSATLQHNAAPRSNWCWRRRSSECSSAQHFSVGSLTG